MQFSTKASSPEKHRTPCLVVGIFEPRRLSAAAESLDRGCAGKLRVLLKQGDMEGKLGSTRALYGLAGIAAERVVLVGLGRAEDLDVKSYRTAMRAAAAAVLETGASRASFAVLDLELPGCDARGKARHAALQVEDAAYRFEELKSTKSTPRPLRAVELISASSAVARAAAPGAVEGRAIGAGMKLTRDLGNLPGNVCTPAYLAAQARRLAREWKLGCQVLEQRALERLGMHSYLAVTRGSRQPPKFIVLKYLRGARSLAPICLVGKGITFDTGGISLKPGAEMDEMKWDMSGAGSVIGTIRALAELKLKVNVIGVIPACENMPDGNAIKPGDIVRSMSGQTIEILNTDAEGRLILCDALTYVERFKPRAVIDIATLTGACVIALGHIACGLYSNRDDLADELLAAGRDSWDRAWRMPLWDDYHEQLKSNFADMANIGGRPAGSVTAACFLSKFAKKYPWAHLDIAGTAWRGGANKGATGRTVPLLMSYLMARAATR